MVSKAWANTKTLNRCKVLKQRKCVYNRQSHFSPYYNHVGETLKAPLETRRTGEHLWFKCNQAVTLTAGSSKAKSRSREGNSSACKWQPRRTCRSAFSFMFLLPHISLYFPICPYVITHNRWQRLHYAWHRAHRSVQRALEYPRICQMCGMPC